MRSKELARTTGKRACESAQVQFLDDTVELVRVRVRRDHRGQLGFHREYRFEFSDDGAGRRQGKIELLGRRVLHVSLEPHRFPERLHQAGPPPPPARAPRVLTALRHGAKLVSGHSQEVRSVPGRVVALVLVSLMLVPVMPAAARPPAGRTPALAPAAGVFLVARRNLPSPNFFRDRRAAHPA
ncbi:MAG: DUF3301 domain-containing protein [Desulfobacterales bacterium]|nr:DUF3301 domain-containing protein [Desulfobacterales bacterium]